MPWRLSAALFSFMLLASAAYLNGLHAALSLGIADAQSASNCGLRAPAFCDTFDSPYTGGGRTGQLDPTRWSIARVSSMVNPAQGMVSYFPPADAMHCKTPVSGLAPPNDYFVCGAEFGESNHFMEAFNDGGNYVFNDARIRQPFDFTGRTGTVTFDVDAKTAGGHGWWVEFWLTEQPIAAPHHNQVITDPRNGIGLEFSDPCGGAIPSGTDGSPLGGLLVVKNFHNYVDSESVPWQAAPDGLTLHHVACYTAMPDMQNHFEIRVSQTHLEVWATDAGPSGPLKQIATVDGINLPFSQGYVHLQHAQYNAEKAAEPSHVSHAQTYHWDNVGFDGPVLPVPAQYSIPDSLAPGPSGGINVGYLTNSSAGILGGPPTFTNVSPSGATGAVLTFDVNMRGPNLNYRFNGRAWHTWTARTTSPWNAALVPVDVSELHTGSNTIDFAAVSDGSPYPEQVVVSNIDLIVGGTVGTSVGPITGSPSRPTPTSMLTPTVTLTPTPTPPTTPSPANPQATMTPAPPTAPQANSASTGGNHHQGDSNTGLNTGGAVVAQNGGGSGDLNAGRGGGGQVVSLSAPAAPPTATATPPGNPSSSASESVAPLLLHAAVDLNGGRLQTDTLTISVPPDVVDSNGGDLSLLLLDPSAVPAPAAGFQLGSSAFLVTLTEQPGAAQLDQMPSPLAVVYRLNGAEIAQAGGDLDRLKVATWTYGSWVAVACRRDNGPLECSMPRPGLAALLVAPPVSDTLEISLPNGWFYKEANGFGGSGERGFAVVDDADAGFWSSLQQMGGVERLGYPITARFEYEGHLTQVFQKLALQWRPELGRAVTVNIFDELSARGSDGWLDNMRAVPRPAPTIFEDSLAWLDIQDHHLRLLDGYPDLLSFYEADPEATTTYGLPISIREYGSVVSVRLQRGLLHLWRSDTPGASRGTVVVGNAGDLANEVGTWPAAAVVPSTAPPPPAASPADAA